MKGNAFRPCRLWTQPAIDLSLFRRTGGATFATAQCFLADVTFPDPVGQHASKCIRAALEVSGQIRQANPSLLGQVMFQGYQHYDLQFCKHYELQQLLPEVTVT